MELKHLRFSVFVFFCFFVFLQEKTENAIHGGKTSRFQQSVSCNMHLRLPSCCSDSVFFSLALRFQAVLKARPLKNPTMSKGKQWKFK